MIELDGSKHEGGGQIIRTALALSSLTKKPFKASHIRKNRSKPGLKKQHLKCIEALSTLTDAVVRGNEIKSEELIYYPREYYLNNIEIDMETAGSTTLLLQSLLPFLIFQNKSIKINVKGGTDVPFSIPYNYFSEVIIPNLKRFCDIDSSLIRRGYYPKGNGEIEISIRPKKKERIDINDKGNLLNIKGISHSSRDLCEREVAERQASSAEFLLKSKNIPLNISREYSNTDSTGSGMVLCAVFADDEKGESEKNIRMGGDCLGERDKSSEIVGRDAAHELIDLIHSSAPIDKHLGDNLIPYLGINHGSINVSEITQHTLANIYVCEKFLPVKFSIDRNENIIKAEPIEAQS